jgi:NAD(P)H-hydrate epimerase
MLFLEADSIEIEGKLATIHQLNQIEACKISIDIPSGIFADKIIDKDSTVLKQETLSFQFYKKAFLHPETGIFVVKFIF